MNNIEAEQWFINSCIEAYMDITGIDYYHKDLVEMVDYLNEVNIEQDNLTESFEITKFVPSYNINGVNYYSGDMDIIGEFDNGMCFVEWYLEVTDKYYTGGDVL